MIKAIKKLYAKFVIRAVTVCICLCYALFSASANEFSTKAEIINPASVPKQIMSNFEFYYPVAKVIRWEKEKTAYKAYVINEKIKEIVSFEYDGDWIKTEQIISKDQIPIRADNFIKEKFSMYSVGECYYVSYSNSFPSYLVYVHLKSSRDYTRPLLFDIAGMIKKIDGLEVRQTGDITADDYTEKKADTATVRQKQETISKSANITAGENVLRISDIIMKQFSRRFPRAEKVSWTKQGQEFIAKLINYDQQIEAVFLENGMQVYTSYLFDKYNIPDPIAAYFKNDPTKYKFVSGKRVVYESRYRRSVVETASGERPKDFYEVIVSNRVPKPKRIEYYRFRFNQTGQFEFKMPYEMNK
ncbi:MAG: hypothetical protein LBG17_07725 [Bacteroidales bacterium]|jgi:hypothetical protein|nr:hypothetical protein [Bacteroidales bacterium]